MLSTESLFVLENRTIGASAKNSCFEDAVEIESVTFLDSRFRGNDTPRASVE